LVVDWVVPVLAANEIILDIPDVGLPLGNVPIEIFEEMIETGIPHFMQPGIRSAIGKDLGMIGKNAM
jgi:hypothetical protein